jgi:hypothetical protein
MKRRFLLFLAASLLLAFLTACTGAPNGLVEEPSEPAEPSPQEPEPTLQEEEYDIKTTPEGVNYIVDPEDIVGGGPPKDGIPSIDNPRFVSMEEADEWIEDNELVLGLTYEGVTRVYPLQIMVWHEIVNDTVAGDPLLITY